MFISRKANVGEHISGGEQLSPDLIRQVQGEVGLEETAVQLTPLSTNVHAPDETLALASTQLIHSHLQNCKEALLLAQVIYTLLLIIILTMFYTPLYSFIRY